MLNRDEAAASPAAIACRDLVLAYGSFIAVNGLTLSVRRGECFGLLGPNGAGKTTAVEAFEGLNRPKSGQIEILGESWGKSPASDRRLRARLGVTLQETQFPEKLTVWETLRLFGSFYKKGRDIAALAESLGIAHKRKARVGGLSGGERQRLALATALVGDPEVLFLDEPTTGLDPNARRGMWQGVEAFVRDGGTVLLTTHYMEEAARLCHRVGIMDAGSVKTLGPPAELVQMLGAEEVIEVSLESNGTEAAAQAVRGVPGVVRVSERGDGLALFVEDAPTALPALFAAFSAKNVTVKSLSTRKASLEDVFIHLTGKTLSGEA